MTTRGADRSMALSHMRTRVWIRVCDPDPIRRPRARHGVHLPLTIGRHEAGAPRARLPYASETDRRDASPALQSP